MKKYVSYLGGLLIVVGFILIIGSCEAMQQDAGAESQFWVNLLISIIMISNGLWMTRLYYED